MAERSGLQNGRITAGSPLLCGSGEQCSDGKGGFQGRPLSWVQEEIFGFALCDLSRGECSTLLPCTPPRLPGQRLSFCFARCFLRVLASGFAFSTGRPFGRGRFFIPGVSLDHERRRSSRLLSSARRARGRRDLRRPTRAAWPHLRQERPEMVLRRFMSRSGGSPNTRLYSLLNCVTLS